jgi:glycerol-3-phosphate dehydrogenase
LLLDLRRGLVVGGAPDVLAPYGSRPPASADAADSLTALIERCAKHAVRTEMAIELDDFLHRRNDLAATGRLTVDLVRTAAAAMGRELGWPDPDVESRSRQACKRLRYMRGECMVGAPGESSAAW